MAIRIPSNLVDKSFQSFSYRQNPSRARLLLLAAISEVKLSLVQPSLAHKFHLVILNSLGVDHSVFVKPFTDFPAAYDIPTPLSEQSATFVKNFMG